MLSLFRPAYLLLGYSGAKLLFPLSIVLSPSKTLAIGCSAENSLGRQRVALLLTVIVLGVHMQTVMSVPLYTFPEEFASGRCIICTHSLLNFYHREFWSNFYISIVSTFSINILMWKCFYFIERGVKDTVNWERGKHSDRDSPGTNTEWRNKKCSTDKTTMEWSISHSPFVLISMRATLENAFSRAPLTLHLVT